MPMKRFLIILSVALITVVILLFIYNPGLLDKIWLWVVGLAGALVALVQDAYKAVEKKVNQLATKSGEEKPAERRHIPAAVSLLRIKQNDGVVAGMIFLEDTFLAFSLEPSENLLPEGNYRLVRSQQAQADRAYAAAYPWFSGHLEVQSNSGSLIHMGGMQQSPAGSIILATDLNPAGFATSGQQRTAVYQKLYTYVQKQLSAGNPVHLAIYNKNWFSDTFN